MIYLDSTCAFLESIYLDKSCSKSIKNSIIVNPKSAYYTNKVIIVNCMEVDMEILNKLSISNRIISRFPIDIPSINLVPYEEDYINRFRYSNILKDGTLSPNNINEQYFIYDQNRNLCYLDSFDGYENTVIEGHLNIVGLIELQYKLSRSNEVRTNQ